MKLLSNGFFYFAVLLVILSIATPETEGRRLVLQGRRTITRHYYRPMGIPAWAIVLLVAIANLLIGVALYFILRKVVLSGTNERIPMASTYAPAAMSEESYPIRQAA